jgi:hypothetical protein
VLASASGLAGPGRTPPSATVAEVPGVLPAPEAPPARTQPLWVHALPDGQQNDPQQVGWLAGQ